MKKGLIPATLLAMLALLATGCGVNVNPGTSSQEPSSSQTSESGSQGDSESGSQGGSESQSGGSESGSQGGSESSSEGGSSESSGGQGSSSEQEEVNYGSETSPLTPEQLFTEVAKLTSLGNKDYSPNYFYVKGALKEINTSSTATSGKYVLYAGSGTLETSSTRLDTDVNYEDICQNDLLLIKGYVRKDSSKPGGYYISYNQSAPEADQAPMVLSREAGESTITINVAHATVNGLNAKETNGTSPKFTVTPDTGYRVSGVSVNNEALNPDGEGAYTFKVAGDMTVVITTEEYSEDAHVTSVEITGANELELGNTTGIQLSVAVTGDAGVSSEVEWSVEEGDTIVAVSAAGVVTPLAVGTAVIKATTVAEKEDGTHATATKQITVKNTYGTENAPLSIPAALALIGTESGVWTAQQIYVAGEVKSISDWKENYNEETFVLTDGEHDLKCANVLYNDDIKHGDVVVGDNLVIHGWGEYYNSEAKLDGYSGGGKAYPTIVRKEAGVATLNIVGDTDKVTITGKSEIYHNGDKVSLTIALNDPDDYTLTVKLGETPLEPTEGKYEFTISGTVTLTIEAASKAAKATDVAVIGAESATSVKLGDTLQMSATVNGDAGVSQAVAWTVTNTDGSATDLATISNGGLLTPEKAGTVKVVATTTEAKDADDQFVVGSLEITIEQKTVLGLAGGSVVKDLVAKVVATNKNKDLYIDDGTAGILVRSSTDNQFSALAVDDLVKVSGTVAVYKNGLQIGSPTVTKLDSGSVTPSSAQALTAEHAAELFAMETMPTATKLSFRTDIVGVDGSYPIWNLGDVKFERASYSVATLEAGSMYDVEGYIQGTYTNSASVKYLLFVVTSATPVAGKITLTASANSVTVGEDITLSAESANLESPTYTWSVEAGTGTASLSATSGASVTLTGETAGKVTVKVTNNAGYSANKEITIVESGEPELVIVTKTIAQIASANSWVNATAYPSFALDSNITVSCSGSDANTGKYYSSGNDWRLYASGNATFTIAAVSGYTISSITVKFSGTITGITSETELSIDDSTWTSGATTSNAKITSITVAYYQN